MRLRTREDRRAFLLPKQVEDPEAERDDLRAKLAKAREALEIIAGRRACSDNLMSNSDVAREALTAIEEEA